MPSIDLEKLLVGDWRGAATTGLAVFGTAVVLALALVALANPEGIDLKQYLTLSSLMVTSAFGGDIKTGLDDSDFEMALSVGAYPLTLTIAALAVGSYVFWRRVSRQSPTLVEALVHAGRASLVLAGLLAISGLLLRTSLHLPEELAFLGMPDLQGTIGTDTATTVVLGFLYLFLTCAATCLRQRDWLPEQIKPGRDFLVLPAVGVAAVLAMTCLVGLIAGIGVIFTVDEMQETSFVALLLATVPNVGLSLFFTGGGAAVEMASSGSEGDFSEARHLTTLADQVSGWVWLMPLATALALIAGAVAVVLYSRSAKEARDGLLRWLGTMTLASPLLAHFAAVHGHARGSDFGEDYWAHMVAGVSWWQSMLLTALWAFVAAVLAAGYVPKVFREPAGTPLAPSASKASEYAYTESPPVWPQPPTFDSFGQGEPHVSPLAVDNPPDSLAIDSHRGKQA